MTVTDRDRATRSYKGWLSISPPDSLFHNKVEYAERCYLRDAVRLSMEGALVSGRLAVLTDDETHIGIPLNGEILFVKNKCDMRVILSAGVYRAMNVRDEFGDDRRARANGLLLWVADAEWQRVRKDLIEQRTRQFQSVQRHGLDRLLSWSNVNLTAEKPQSSGWTEERMLSAISTCSISNRDRAWREIFKAKEAEHRWNNDGFRKLWPIGRGTSGLKGRPSRNTRE